MGRKRENLIGKRFNQLTVIRFNGRMNSDTCWLCKCDCGNYTYATTQALKKGKKKGCGCLRGRNSKYKNPDKNIYKRWWHMINRCNNPKDISYKNYGARGIKVCIEWLNYDNFYEWAMQNGYRENLELDRIDTNEDYCPNNCRFISRVENSRNRRISLHYKCDNIDMPLAEIAKKYDVNYKTLWQRIKRDGMDIKEAVKDGQL